jgi:hypothetical protein
MSASLMDKNPPRCGREGRGPGRFADEMMGYGTLVNQVTSRSRIPAREADTANEQAAGRARWSPYNLLSEGVFSPFSFVKLVLRIRQIFLCMVGSCIGPIPGRTQGGRPHHGSPFDWCILHERVRHKLLHAMTHFRKAAPRTPFTK